MERFYEWWTTWIWGGPWLILVGEVAIKKHKCGFFCHIDAWFRAGNSGRTHTVLANFRTENWKYKQWTYPP